MANVLIGIIGVILFIGLALAGALILGDDFKAANATSKAARYVSEINQIASAINMYELKTGRGIADVAPVSTLKPRFLAQNFNPSINYTIRTVLNPKQTFVYVLLPSSEDAVCAQVQQTFGGGNIDGSLNRSVVWDYGIPAGAAPMGCMPYMNQASTILYKAF